MNGNCHFVFGASTATALALNIDKIANLITVNTNLSGLEVNETTVTLFVMGGLLGSVFPDVDNPNSLFGKMSAPLSTVIGKVGASFGKTGTHHRGIFHDLLIYLIALTLSVLFFPPLIGFFVGCLSHILLDSFTPMGIPCLFTKRGIHLGKINSGSTTAVVFSYVLSMICLTLGFVGYFAFQ